MSELPYGAKTSGEESRTDSPVVRRAEAPTYATNVSGAFTPEEYSRRYHAVADLMRAKGLAGILYYGSRSPGDIHYLSNWIPSTEAYLLWPLENDPVLLVQLFNHVSQARQMSVVDDVRFGGSNHHGGVDTTGRLREAIAEKGLSSARIGVAGPVPYRSFSRIEGGLTGGQLIDVSAEMRQIRSVRSEEEFQRITRAAGLSDRAVRALAESMVPGMTELDLARIVDEAQAHDGGYTTLRHMVSTPMRHPSACVPAKYLTDRRINKGDAVVVELSAGWGGYSGQVLRTYAVGEKPTAQFDRLHRVALTAYERARSAVRDGASVDDVLEAVEVIDEAGFSICDDLLHGANQFPPIVRTRQTSHGIAADFRFREGMAVVIQPNVVTKDWSAGVQYGQMLRVTRDGTEELHHAPEGLIMCGC